MARGITETDVHTAADELVAAGERPTVDRIRAHLGTGSPNTVTRWLETWWLELAPRLQAHRIQLALPAAPAPVGRLAQQLWEHALAAAREEAEAGVASQRNALAAQATVLEQEAVSCQARLAQQQQSADRAESAHASALAELALARALIERQDAQIADLTTQRDAAEGARERLAEQVAETAVRQQHDAAKAQEERDALRLHMQTMEDRAQREVDRARQEAKQSRLELTAMIKQQQGQLQAARQGEEEARNRVTKQDLELADLRARLQLLAERRPERGEPARRRTAAKTPLTRVAKTGRRKA